jgi:hypothetical protein
MDDPPRLTTVSGVSPLAGTVCTASAVEPVTEKRWVIVRPVGGPRGLLSVNLSSLSVTMTSPGRKAPLRRNRYVVPPRWIGDPDTVTPDPPKPPMLISSPPMVPRLSVCPTDGLKVTSR